MSILTRGLIVSEALKPAGQTSIPCHCHIPSIHSACASCSDGRMASDSCSVIAVGNAVLSVLASTTFYGTVTGVQWVQARQASVW